MIQMSLEFELERAEIPLEYLPNYNHDCDSVEIDT